LRVLVVAATGAIGIRLVPQLIDRGHQVIGTSRSPERAERLRAKPPHRFPRALARLFAGEAPFVMGPSRWTPRHMPAGTRRRWS
jgi:uncharacterized protein YbjT (DUF2867 family)